MCKIESKTVKIVDASDFQYFLAATIPAVPAGAPNLEAAQLSDDLDKFYETNPMDYSWGNNAKTLIGLAEFVRHLRPCLPQKLLLMFDKEVSRLVEDGVEYVDLEN